jgi:hypothetical protein
MKVQHGQSGVERTGRPSCRCSHPCIRLRGRCVGCEAVDHGKSTLHGEESTRHHKKDVNERGGETSCKYEEGDTIVLG